MLFENLTQYQIEEYREIFKLFDYESQGVIKNNKLKTILNTLGHYLTNNQINGLIEIVDRDKSGTIDFEEFIFLMAMGCEQNHALIQDTMEIFSFLDKNGDNKITREELFETLYHCCYDNTSNPVEREREIEGLKKFIDQIFSEGDSNGDGELDFQQFLEIIFDFN